ncbi:hypothetical protein F2P81_002642 [Scophthalmus maximus]|uniref:Uncharacterized protein n=1 Tax=Scophthalmus maximus TaxID=52904 RepID=A0A6A4TJB6_SCOMX|nr:hypothetical protein F2P81_002642 [Scophthalmus maximus]
MERRPWHSDTSNEILRSNCCLLSESYLESTFGSNIFLSQCDALQPIETSFRTLPGQTCFKSTSFSSEKTKCGHQTRCRADFVEREQKKTYKQTMCTIQTSIIEVIMTSKATLTMNATMSQGPRAGSHNQQRPLCKPPKELHQQSPLQRALPLIRMWEMTLGNDSAVSIWRLCSLTLCADYNEIRFLFTTRGM